MLFITALLGLQFCQKYFLIVFPLIQPAEKQASGKFCFGTQCPVTFQSCLFPFCIIPPTVI